MLALTLHAWSDVAQLVIAGAAILALVGATVQILLTRSLARRSLSYSYADRFNEPSMAIRIAKYQRYWDTHTYDQWYASAAVHDVTAQAILIVPNLIEEVATAYNRKLLDRNVAAMYLGSGIAVLWHSSAPLVTEARAATGDEWLYYEWQTMMADTQERLMREQHRIERKLKFKARMWAPGY
jgi:hypothetical protein